MEATPRKPEKQYSQPSETPYVRPLEPSKKSNKKAPYAPIFLVFGLLILVGIGTGYLLANPGKTVTTSDGKVVTSSDGKSFGSTDTKTFTDTAVGKVEKGGIKGEGTHKLIREGGETQTACLVSSVLDLDEFVGKKVKVYSKTMASKECPWLMDVGRIELQ